MKPYNAVLGLIIIQCAPSAWGQLAQNLTIGNAKALALANAVTADPPGIDSIHFNPAGLTQLKGRQYQLKIIGGDFEISGELERSEEYQQALKDNNFEDPVNNGKSSTNKVSAMLPFAGLTELPVLLAPVGGASITSPEGRLTFANAIYAPMVVGYTREDDDPLRYQGKALGFTQLTLFSPSIGWRINDEWSIGGSIGFNYTGVGLNMDFRVPNVILAGIDQLGRSTCGDNPYTQEFNGIIDICQGDLGPFTDIGALNVEVDTFWSPSVNFGVLWKALPWLTWGAAIQSGAKADLKGDYDIQYNEDWQDFFQGLNHSPGGNVLVQLLGLPTGKPRESGGANLEFSIPAHVATGISIQATPRFKLNVDAKYTKTSDWNEFKIEFDRDVEFLSILSRLAPEYVTDRSITFPRGYVDTFSWAVGSEYQYTSQLAFRVGYEDRPSAIPDDKSDFIAPFGDAYLVGTGISYKPDKFSEMDLSLGRLSSKNGARSNGSSNVNDTGADNIIYNPYAGYHTKSMVEALLIEYSYRTYF